MSALHCRPLAEEYLGNRPTAGRSTMNLTGNKPLPVFFTSLVAPLDNSRPQRSLDSQQLYPAPELLGCIFSIRDLPISVADINRFIPARTVSTFNRTGFWLSQSHLMRSTSGREDVLIT